MTSVPTGMVGIAVVTMDSEDAADKVIEAFNNTVYAHIISLRSIEYTF